MKLARSKTEGIALDDRTGSAFTAASIAPLLRGEVPADFVGRLYPYQLDGYRWLSFMTDNGLGGVVADEMGLGKTIQVICLLLEAQHRTRHPNLVLTPTTLLENWRRELAKFGPSLRVLVHSGKARTGDPADLVAYDVVLCSIDTAVVDIALLRNIDWYLLVVDEAQNIRNPGARRTIQVKTIQRECAIAVTGTPLENRLQDLWSITDFIMPSLLGSLCRLRTSSSRHYFRCVDA